MLDLEQTVTLELRNAKSAAVCWTNDGYGYVIMPLARDKKAQSQPAREAATVAKE